jgi:hypothetical protein
MFPLERWALLGDAVGGFATLCGLLFAIYEVSRRRSASLEEKRSAAAAQALTHLTRAVAALTRWQLALDALLDYQVPPEDEPHTLNLVNQLGRAHRATWRDVERRLTELHDALTTAMVHLSARETAGLLAVHDLAHEMHDHVEDTLSFLEPADLPSRDHELRSAIRDGVASCQKQVELTAGMLQPIAHLKG